MKILNAVRGISGEFEISRLLGALGVTAYIFGAHTFVAYDVFGKGRPFDVVAYCAAFPTGLGVVLGALAGAVAWKDKAVASAKVTEQTGAVPTPAIDGAKVPTGDPPPVQGNTP